MALNVRTIVAHPIAKKTWTVVRRVLIVVSVILAVALVTAFTIDLGPVLKGQAEAQGSRFIGRPLHIGRMSVRLWKGQYQFDDLRIEGLTPDARPFFTARTIKIGMLWRTLFNRRIVIDHVELSDWTMLVEQMPNNGPVSFPRIRLPRRDNAGPSRWTTTVPYVRAHRGEFIFEDHGTPWSVAARNIDILIGRQDNQYRGTAKFSNGTVKIQSYEPFAADMRSQFTIDQGRVLLHRIDLLTDGARTILNGDVNMSYWPEQMFALRSTIDFSKMREIFFARDRFSLSGAGEFAGTFHLFRDVNANGEPRMGRELKGTLTAASPGVNAHRFPKFRGEVKWTPDFMSVTDASSDFYGGRTRFTYLMAPLGRRGVRATHTLDAELEAVDLTTYSDFLELDGLRLAGRLDGSHRMTWPSGRWSSRDGEGAFTLTAPEGVETQTRHMPIAELEERAASGEPWGPFSSHTPLAPVPIAGQLAYTFDPDGITMQPSSIATPETFVEFEGFTSWGLTDSRMPFHVTSTDWQESDRFFAGFLTAVGARTPAIPVGGYGTFDGVVLNELRRPRIEGAFAGEKMRAFNTVWGAVSGNAVIENSYADVKDVVISSGPATIRTEGRFSLGFPRRDGGEEINARITLAGRPVVDLRRAFGILDYDLDGNLSGEFRVYGNYLSPLGFGTMTITDGVAYGQNFDRAEAAVRLEGEGVRLDNISMTKGTGRGTGAAYVGFNGSYSFNFDARSIPMDAIQLGTASAPSLSGLVDFAAGGSGTFDMPRYDVRGTIRDLFVADEGIGQVIGNLGINGRVVTVGLEAASPRLAVSGVGRIEMTPTMDAEMSLRVVDTSLDPYLRAFQPNLSPFTTAVASGNIRIAGPLANRERLLVDTTVDRLDVRLFDYSIANASPIRMVLEDNVVRVDAMRLVGQDTQLDVSGRIGMSDEQLSIVANGDANLGLLQGFVSNIRSSGRAVLAAKLEGPLREPTVSGTMTIMDGRIRHFGLPHALENVGGAVRFDSRVLNFDDLEGRLGGGAVDFGGTIGMNGYRPGRLDVTVAGTNMRLRYPEGMRSLVDASVALQGTPEAAVLSGTVTVRDAVYSQPFSGGDLLDLGGGAVSTSGGPAQTTIPLRYDVRISAPSSLQVRNNVARLVASANLQMQGTYDRPLLFGRAQVERGDVTFEGRRYEVTRGTIDFNNPIRIEPFIDVEAETRIRVPGETYRVTARATGTMERLSAFSFESDPPLPQIEVLALVFSDFAPGQDVEFRRYASVTPQEQLLRERVTRRLTGTISSEVDRVAQQTFGVDTFQITPSLVDPNQQSSRLDPAARLTIGKRLSDRAYLTYSRSLSSVGRDQIILLEYDQTDRFSWIVSRNEDGTYAVDVRLRRTF